MSQDNPSPRRGNPASFTRANLAVLRGEQAWFLNDHNNNFFNHLMCHEVITPPSYNKGLDGVRVGRGAKIGRPVPRGRPALRPVPWEKFLCS